MDLSKILSFSMPDNGTESSSSSSDGTLETTTLRPEQFEDNAHFTSTDLPPISSDRKAPSYKTLPNLVIEPAVHGHAVCPTHPPVWTHSGSRWSLVEDARLSFLLENLKDRDLYESMPALSQIFNRDDDSIQDRKQALVEKFNLRCVDCIRLEEWLKWYRQRYFGAIWRKSYIFQERTIEVFIPPPRHVYRGDTFPLPVVIKLDPKKWSSLPSVHVSLGGQHQAECRFDRGYSILPSLIFQTHGTFYMTISFDGYYSISHQIICS